MIQLIVALIPFLNWPSLLIKEHKGICPHLMPVYARRQETRRSVVFYDRSHSVEHKLGLLINFALQPQVTRSKGIWLRVH